jgi:hypothetical protein
MSPKTIPVTVISTKYVPVWFYMESPIKSTSIWEWRLVAQMGGNPECWGCGRLDCRDMGCYYDVDETGE